MSRRRRFSQVDVFTDRPLLGNPVAVVHDREGLTAAQMQAFTDWTNLSEATFLGPPSDPDADYSLRIFCPGRELLFAGHPTLGSCHAWLESGGEPKGDLIVQECGAGLVRIRRDVDGGRLAFAAPPLRRSGPLSEGELESVARFLRIDRADVAGHAWCDNGPAWRVLLLRSAQQVLALKPDPSLQDGRDVGVVGRHPDASDALFEVRAFFPGNQGLAEDPVTGSLNAALAQWLIGEGLAPERYVVAQGTALGRSGRVAVERSGDDVWIGGCCVSVVEGTVAL